MSIKFTARHLPSPLRNWQATVAATLAVVISSWIGAEWTMGAWLHHKGQWLTDPWNYVQWSASAIAVPHGKHFPSYLLYRETLASIGILPTILHFHSISIPFAITTGIATGWFVGKPAPAEIQTGGRRVVDDTRKAQKAMKNEIKRTGKGILIHPKIPMSLERETRSLLVFGSVGSGKTTVIGYCIDQAVARSDRVLVYDSKGDYTATIPGECTLLAPWDERSHGWDIGADCIDKGDARTVASRIIPDSQDPIWAAGARQLLVGVLVMLQVTKGTTWGLDDIIRGACSEFDQLRKIVMQYNPEGMRIVESATSRTTQGFLINLGTYLGDLCDMCDAWAGREQISFRRWLHRQGNEADMKTIVLQGNKRYASLERAYVQSIVSLLAGNINSPDFPDSQDRRIWFFLDEFPQIGKLDHFSSLIETGRSKGIRVVLGVQDVAQMRELYGDDTVSAWTSMIGTVVIMRTQGAETPDWLARLIGTKRIMRYGRSRTIATGHYEAKASVTEKWESQEVPVIYPDQFGVDLGPEKKGVKGFFFPRRESVYRIVWPFRQPNRYRESCIAANHRQVSLEIIKQNWATPSAPEEKPSRPAKNTSQRKIYQQLQDIGELQI